MQFQKLPAELITHIFTKLSDRELCDMAQVCKKFKIIANDGLLWKHRVQVRFGKILSRSISEYNNTQFKNLYKDLSNGISDLSWRQCYTTWLEKHDIPPHHKTHFIKWTGKVISVAIRGKIERRKMFVIRVMMDFGHFRILQLYVHKQSLTNYMVDMICSLKSGDKITFVGKVRMMNMKNIYSHKVPSWCSLELLRLTSRVVPASSTQLCHTVDLREVALTTPSPSFCAIPLALLPNLLLLLMVPFATCKFRDSLVQLATGGLMWLLMPAIGLLGMYRAIMITRKKHRGNTRDVISILFLLLVCYAVARAMQDNNVLQHLLLPLFVGGLVYMASLLLRGIGLNARKRVASILILPPLVLGLVPWTSELPITPLQEWHTCFWEWLSAGVWEVGWCVGFVECILLWGAVSKRYHGNRVQFGLLLWFFGWVVYFSWRYQWQVLGMVLVLGVASVCGFSSTALASMFADHLVAEVQSLNLLVAPFSQRIARLLRRKRRYSLF